MNYPILDSLSNPKDLKKISKKLWPNLIEEVRACINENVKKNGGHLGPNLGTVEIILACHLVFNLDSDRIIFDVGHQSYPHKILTSRYKQFENLRKKNGLSGYPYNKESQYDVFRGGHASTSISTALGIRCGFDYEKVDSKKYVIALVGDGAMTGGMSFEGLNHSGHLKKNLIVILNDNSMSISPTVGGLAKTFNDFRHSNLYTNLEGIMEGMTEKLKHIPKIGQKLEALAKLTVDEAAKFVTPGQIFTILGFDYLGPINGNKTQEVIKALEKAKTIKNKPILIHALTEKGKGYQPDGRNSETLIGPHALSPPKTVVSTDKPQTPSYSAKSVEVISQLSQKDKKIIAITAAMADGTGLVKFQELFPDRYYDVGICEAHAVGFSAGLVHAGMKPVFMVYSTFLQRAFDQIFHELILQDNLPVVFCIDRAGLVGDDGPSHHGSYDIAYLRIFPHLVIMAPKDGNDLKDMLELGLKLKVTSVIRYPRTPIPPPTYFKKTFKSLQKLALGKSEIINNGDSKICLYAYGSMVYQASQAYERLLDEGINVSLVNVRFVKPLDAKTLKTIYLKHQTIIVLEEGIVRGGLGSAVLEELNLMGLDSQKIILRGLPDALVEHASRDQQLEECGLDVESIIKLVKKNIHHKIK